jgi:hypothetical protein
MGYELPKNEGAAPMSFARGWDFVSRNKLSDATQTNFGIHRGFAFTAAFRISKAKAALFTCRARSNLRDMVRGVYLQGNPARRIVKGAGYVLEHRL